MVVHQTRISFAGAVGSSSSRRFLKKNQKGHGSVGWSDSKLAGTLKREYHERVLTATADAERGKWRGMLRNDIRDYKARGADFGVRSTTTAISLFTKLGSSMEGSQMFLNLLSDMIKKRTLSSLSKVTVSAGVHALAKSNCEGVEELRKLIPFLESKQVDVPPIARQLVLRYYAKHDLAKYNELLREYGPQYGDLLLQLQACRSSSEASNVMRTHTGKLNPSEFSALLYCCQNAAECQQVWDRYVGRLSSPLETHQFNTVLSVCRRDSDLKSIQQWLHKMSSCNLPPDAYTFSISIMCCGEIASSIDDFPSTFGIKLFEQAVQIGVADNNKVSGAAAFLFHTTKNSNGLRKVAEFLNVSGLRPSPIMKGYLEGIRDIEHPLAFIDASNVDDLQQH
eukprot:TRINITY_DN28301_c0_g1_i1.p1 TRINITY_DN28301_c0_g1~~TRINITY_DN28301_c0_g1_i1.p1  ORF type:complete len:395 (+),score=56.06 TRINITY_DN28301_c0_g1_i1:73-1257(+)